MKKKWFFSGILGILLFLTCCVTVRIETHFNADGSGERYIIQVYDMEERQEYAAEYEAEAPAQQSDYIEGLVEEAQSEYGHIPGAYVESYTDPETYREGERVVFPFNSVEELISISSEDVFGNIDKIGYSEEGNHATLHITVDPTQLMPDLNDLSTEQREQLRESSDEITGVFEYVIEVPGQILTYTPQENSRVEGNRITWNLIETLIGGEPLTITVKYDLAVSEEIPVEAPAGGMEQTREPPQETPSEREKNIREILKRIVEVGTIVGLIYIFRDFIKQGLENFVKELKKFKQKDTGKNRIKVKQEQPVSSKQDLQHRIKIKEDQPPGNQRKSPDRIEVKKDKSSSVDDPGKFQDQNLNPKNINKRIRIEEPQPVRKEKKKQPSEASLDILLHLQWWQISENGDHKNQWISWIGDQIDKSPELSYLVLSNTLMMLKFDITNRNAAKNKDELDLSSIQLEADFECNQINSGINLYGKPFIKIIQKDGQRVTGVFTVKKPLKVGQHSFTLSATDTSGHNKKIKLVFNIVKLCFIDEDKQELESIPLVWKKWTDYKPFSFKVMLEDHSIPTTEKKITMGLRTRQQNITDLTLTRSKNAPSCFLSEPILAWAFDEKMQGFPDEKAIISDPAHRKPVWIRGQPGEKVEAYGRDLRNSLPTPDRRAVLLSPALGCPALVHEQGHMDVLLLMREEQWPQEKLPQKADIAFALGWCRWEARDKNEVNLFRKDDIAFVYSWDIKDGIGAFKGQARKEDGIINYIPSNIHEMYAKNGYGKRVAVTVRIPEKIKPGMYSLIALYDEGYILQEKILSALNKPQGSPGPVLRVDWTKGFLNKKEHKPVRAYHPVAVYKKGKATLNIAHLSDTHIAARSNLLQQRWDGKTKSWDPDLKYDRITAKKLWRECVKLFSVHEKPGEFNNPNEQTLKMLQKIGQDQNIDVIIITGDLIDYNRGLKWYDKKAAEKNNLDEYLMNVNWLCFYELLEDNYQKPIFTVLGNHDWLVNPTLPHGYFSSEFNVTEEEIKFLHGKKGGSGTFAELWSYLSSFGEIEPDSLLYTSSDATKWYFSAINPFSDYSFRFGRQAFAMLDWVNGDIDLGSLLKTKLPWAKSTFSTAQWQFLQNWNRSIRSWDADQKQESIRIVSTHAPIFCPFPEIGDEENNWKALSDLKKYDPKKDAIHGTLMKHRNDFIHFMHTHGGLVLSGHTHRSGIYHIKNKNTVACKPPSAFHGKSSVDQALFTVIGSSGMIGFYNKKGKTKSGKPDKRLTPPVYRQISFDRQGNYTCLDEKSVQPVSIRSGVRLDYGEISAVSHSPLAEKGYQYEVWTWYGVKNYFWTVKNISSANAKPAIDYVAVKLDIPYKAHKIILHKVYAPVGWTAQVRPALNNTTIIHFWAKNANSVIKINSMKKFSILLSFKNFFHIKGELAVRWMNPGKKEILFDYVVVPVPLY